MKALISMLIIVTATSLILLVVQNTVPVDSRFLWFRIEMPVFMLLFMTAAGGYFPGVGSNTNRF